MTSIFLPFAGFRQRLVHGIEHLFPAYFAVVMATGIVSLASHLRGVAPLAWALLALNVIAYTILMALFLVRCCASARA